MKKIKKLFNNLSDNEIKYVHTTCSKLRHNFYLFVIIYFNNKSNEKYISVYEFIIWLGIKW